MVLSVDGYSPAAYENLRNSDHDLKGPRCGIGPVVVGNYKVCVNVSPGMFKSVFRGFS